MKNEIYEKLRSGEIVSSIYDVKSPLPDEVVIIVYQDLSDYRSVEFVSLSQAIKDFNDADENSCISFTVPRYLVWYTRKFNVNIVASAVAKLL